MTNLIKISKYLSILCLFELFNMILTDSGNMLYKKVGDTIKDFRDNHCEGEVVRAANKTDEELLYASMLLLMFCLKQ